MKTTNEDILLQLTDITTIPQHSLQRLMTVMNYCICNSVYESMLQKQPITSLNIGVGVLQIENTGTQLNYKFIPSQQLEKSLVKTITKNENPLADKLETTFTQRIVKTYKDMF